MPGKLDDPNTTWFYLLIFGVIIFNAAWGLLHPLWSKGHCDCLACNPNWRP